MDYELRRQRWVVEISPPSRHRASCPATAPLGSFEFELFSSVDFPNFPWLLCGFMDCVRNMGEAYVKVPYFSLR